MLCEALLPGRPALRSRTADTVAASCPRLPADLVLRHSPCCACRTGFRQRQNTVGLWHRRRQLSCAVRAEANHGEDKPVQYSTEFGYSRKDVLLIGGSLLGLGFGLYYGVQALGVEPGKAGNFVQLGIFLALCIGWVSSYLLRVVNKDMTYSKQLEQYEDAVMQKRLEEMPETERARLYEEVEAERKRRGK